MDLNIDLIESLVMQDILKMAGVSRTQMVRIDLSHLIPHGTHLQIWITQLKDIISLSIFLVMQQ